MMHEGGGETPPPLRLSDRDGAGSGLDVEAVELVFKGSGKAHQFGSCGRGLLAGNGGVLGEA